MTEAVLAAENRATRTVRQVIVTENHTKHCSKQVKVHTTSGEHFYDERGALDSSWPHGILNY